MKRANATKIIATLGPATSDEDIIRKLFEAGADIFRMNFSHGTHQDHQERIQTVRKIEREFGRPIAILADLQGPKLRVGKFKNGKITLKDGAEFQLDLDKTPGDECRVNLPHEVIFEALKNGDKLLLDDGRLCLEVIEKQKDKAKVKVLIGGPLSNNKGVNLPDTLLPLSALTDKDRVDLDFALSQNVDWVALSFVQKAQDLVELKEIVGDQAWVMAKLEKPAALEDLENIIHEADAIMVARGDLGVEMPPESVPVIQRQIITNCRRQGVPVVVATQMLDSMVERATPTRAEASDVATAVYNGVDAVMLSAETASGKYPVESVQMMHRIILQVQKDSNFWQNLDARRVPADSTTPDAISSAARQMAELMPAAAIIAYTSSGSTTIRIAKERPHVPIISLTPREATARRMVLVWGVHSTRSPDAYHMKDMAEIAIHQAVIDGFAKSNDRLVSTAGLPFGTPGKTNLIRILRVP